MIGFYAIRPMLVKVFPINYPLIFNWVVQLTFDYILFTNFGWTPFIYFFISIIMCGSIHPVAGHFIAEHYVFEPGQETYSYYGWLNKIAFNVGYHNEHHDFLNIPASKLPELTKIAPEFYENLAQTKSWPLTIYNYIMDEKMSGFSRIKRRPY